MKNVDTVWNSPSFRSLEKPSKKIRPGRETNTKSYDKYTPFLTFVDPI